MDKLYININDYQGGSFAVGLVKTLDEWVEQALEWCEQDDSEEMFEYINNAVKNEELLDFISEVWTIQIVEYDKNNLEHNELKNKREGGVILWYLK